MWIMTPTIISVAILMVAVNVAIFVWLRGSEFAASSVRVTGMMMRVGLRPGTATLGDAQAVAIMEATRRRFRRCPREDLCDRWLAGEVKGSNSFCPNAQRFDVLAGAGGRTA